MATEVTHAGGKPTIDDWLPHWLRLTFALRRMDERWFVLIEEFDITGVGATPEDARDEAMKLLGSYLHAHYEDGATFEQALRPIPRRLRWLIHLGTIVYWVVRRPRTPTEERALVPSAALNGAAC